MCIALVDVLYYFELVRTCQSYSIPLGVLRNLSGDSHLFSMCTEDLLRILNLMVTLYLKV